MYPHERSLVAKFRNQPFAIVGVNSDPDRERLRQLMKTKELAWTTFFDGGGIGGPIATRWGVTGWPTTYVIDHRGVIRATGERGKALEETLDRLVSEAKRKP